MEYPRQITTIQAAAILISTIIGVGVLPLPLFAVRAADSGGPLVTLLAIMVACLGIWVITRLGMKFPSQSIVQYSEQIIGKWPSWIGSSLIILFFAVLASLAAREFGEVVITSVLKKTPLEVTVIIMLLLATLAARNDMSTFTYVHHLYLPMILAPGILIVILSLKNADVNYLMPIWGNEPHGLVKGVLVIAALFQGSFVQTIVIPAMRRPEKAMKASMWGLFVAGGLYFSIVLASVGVFGPEETKHLLWPTLELAKTTTLPGNILERLDAAFLAVWVTAVFTTIFSSYYLTIHLISKLFRLRDHKMLSLFVLPMLFMMAMMPQSILQMYDVIEVIGRYGLILTIMYPLFLLMVARMRRLGRPPHADQSQADTG
ncbi:GerAB/ArcD/ProY family transporter [Paenibacillus hexagrammi]|uniref:Spore germination protein n=1 Tax=Paenibacillus hexagrammi TaxID=2908839 RepID=A0ABY3SKH5_9BACL|nr:endospore germination permease [Paenibacillus sp. YPD9-1]UJF34204.1 spore germination protein [Paenibacillus sp. YPD9-1]